MLRFRRIQGGDLLGYGTYSCVYAPSFPAFQFDMDGKTYSIVASDPSKVALKVFKNKDGGDDERIREQFREVRGESLFTTLDPRGFFHRPYFGAREATSRMILPIVIREIPKRDFESCLSSAAWAPGAFELDAARDVYKVKRDRIVPAVTMPKIENLTPIDILVRDTDGDRFVPNILALLRNVWFGLCLTEGNIVHGDTHAGNVALVDHHSIRDSRSLFLDFGRTMTFEDRVRFPYTLGHIQPIFETSAKENALLWSHSAAFSYARSIKNFTPIFDVEDPGEIARYWSDMFVGYVTRSWMGELENDQIKYLKENAPMLFKDREFVDGRLFKDDWLLQCSSDLKSVFSQGSASLREDLLRKEDLIIHCRSLCKMKFFTSLKDINIGKYYLYSADSTDSTLERQFERITKEAFAETEIRYCTYANWIERLRRKVEEKIAPEVTRYLERKRTRVVDDEDGTRTRRADDESLILGFLWRDYRIERYLQIRYAMEKMHQLSALSFHPFLPAVPYPRQFFQAMLHVARECPLAFKPEWIATSKIDAIFPHDDLECLTNRPEELYFGGYVLEDGSKCVMIRRIPEAVENDLNKSASIAQKAIDLILGTLHVREDDSTRALTTFLLEDFDRYAEPAGGRSRYFNVPPRVLSTVARASDDTSSPSPSVRFESEVNESGSIVKTEVEERNDMSRFTIDTEKFLTRNEMFAFRNWLENVIVGRSVGVRRYPEDIDAIMHSYREKMLA